MDNSLADQLTNLYNDYRSAALNRAYYGCKSVDTRRLNKTFEIIIAIGSSTAIGSWIIFRDGSGASIWAVIAGITTVITIIKPILDLPKQIETYSKLFSGHGSIFYDLDEIVKEVKVIKSFPESLYERYQSLLKRRNELAPDDDPRPDKKLVKKCTDDVNRKIPPTSFWMPS